MPAPTLPPNADVAMTWTVVLLRSDLTLVGVSFVDALHGWTVGSIGGQRGIILASTDGGQSWSEQRTPTAAGLGAVAFVDAQHGWAVGGRGTILATNDGGATWQAQRSGAAADLRGIAATDSQHAWAVGWNGAIVATRDGGLTWQAQRSPSDLPLNAVDFADARNGWAVGGVGDDGVIIATSDGGAHWEKQSGTGSEYADVAFADARQGWAVMRYGILWTDGAGHPWRDAEAYWPISYMAVSSRDASHGWIVGLEESRSEAPVVLCTVGRVSTWAVAWRGESDFVLDDICALPNGGVVAVGYEGRVLVGVPTTPSATATTR